MTDPSAEFIERWIGSGGSERANFQRFAVELTQLLGVEDPKLATEDDQADDYRFERPIRFGATSARSHGFIDLYRKGCFVLEAKQGVHAKARPDPNQLTLLSEEDAPRVVRTGHGARGTGTWAKTMLEARNQADSYARAVAREDGWPPFLLVVDVGHVIEVYSDFSRQGQGYTQFPDRARYQIKLKDLADEDTRTLLRTIWTDPFALDPARKSARVTREISAQLAALGKSLEAQGHTGERVARFLMRCLFTMFAEDVELIEKDSFTDLLKALRGHPEHAAPSLQALWATMNTGGFSPVLKRDLKRFNGGLFSESDALPLNEVQLSLLINAARQDWKAVEPAIFGTLLERALDKRQRHKLGAHYTPRAYVQRLVTPTVMDPLRADWRDVQAGVQRLTSDGKDEDARKLVRYFHQKLCQTRVLDPACGSGNFLYVALEMMKRLEGEVVALLAELGEDQGTLGLSGHTVDPHQFLGIELNPWAAAVAELVLWIGYLQWHFRTYGQAAPSEPVLRDFKNIECRDAVLEWSETRPRLDEAGKPVTRWDSITTITHQVTGEEVPDPDARVQVFDYLKPKAAKWPDAEFIVGNPPFIGASRLRESLGDGYVEALWAAYPKMPQSADLVMFWWEKAALSARAYNAKAGKGTRRFGLITTNSLRQTFNRRVVESHLADPKKPLSLLFAIPDHPWVDTLYGAAVRIAMTVELGELLELDLDFEIGITGFSIPEIDGILEDLAPEDPGDPRDDVVPDPSNCPARCRPGDVWQLGPHRLICGDALDPGVVALLMEEERARMVFADPPYNVPIDGHVGGKGRVKHREFAMAAGEMSGAEFTAFLQMAFRNMADVSIEGAIHFICMDWRHMTEMLAAGNAVYSELKNLLVWDKGNGGMGTFYRSRHELVFAFKVGTAPHVNAFELGQHGRHRTNVWSYRGVNTLKAGRMDELTMHPTVKPVQMIADAIRDVSGRGDIVLDLFGGSGSTLIAAEKTGRRARLAEIDPVYCDRIIARYEAWAKDEAVQLVCGLADAVSGELAAE